MLDLWRQSPYIRKSFDDGRVNPESLENEEIRKELDDLANSIKTVNYRKGSGYRVEKASSGRLTKEAWVFNWPSGRETYYDSDMRERVKNMRNKGYSKKKYPFKIRKDGVKMLGDYVIIAANRNIKGREYGKILDTSLWKWIVCDTGSFVKKHPTWIDIATDWERHRYKRGTIVDDLKI